MERSLHRVLMFATRVILAMFSIQYIPSVSSVSPVAVTGAGYVTANGTLYVQGGGLNAAGNMTTAFLSLSLESSWNDSSPPWKIIDVPINYSFQNQYQSVATTPDNTRLVFWGSFAPPHNASLSVYNILNNTWSTLTLGANSVLYSDGISAVIDPTTPGGGLGNLYAPNGCYSAITNIHGFCVTTLDKKTTSMNPMPGGLVPEGIFYYSFVYSKLRKTMLLYGGATGQQVSNPNLYEYSASTSTWSLLLPQGTPPGDVQRHCMVETTDGTKMIVFGGMNVASQPSSRLFILNLNNLTWTEGANVGSANARVNHVCATNGDSFIVWGGLIVQNNVGVVVNNTPLIYNIPNNTWVQNFVVSNTPPATVTKSIPTSTEPTPTSSNSNTSPPPPPPPSSEKSSSSVAATAGGVAGGIIAIAAIGFFIFRWRRRAGKSDGGPSQLKRSSDGNAATLEKKGGLFGRNNRDEDMDDKGPYVNYPGTHAIQLQDTPVQHTVDPYSSSQFVQPQPSSPPLPPLHQLLAPRPDMPSRNSLRLYENSPRNSKSGIDMMGNNIVSSSDMDPSRFSGINSSSPPLLPFQPRQSLMSLPPTGSPQREEGALGFSQVDPYGQSAYYDAGKNVLTASSPQEFLGSVPIVSQGLPTYHDGVNNVLSGTINSSDFILASTPYSNAPQYNPMGSDGGVRSDPRSPQQYGPGYENSPAAWMAAARVHDSIGGPQALVSPGSEDSSEISNRGSYYPPPPGLQSPAQTEADLMQKRLRLLKAQHELDVEKMRLEQESQRQLIERQFVTGSR